MAQVFISYSRRDLPFVEQLVSDLKKTGIQVWYDLSGLEGGSRWGTEIQNAMQNSDYLIVVLSPDSIESEWVEREYILASNLKKKILPLMYRECKIPLSFLNINFVDVQGENYSRNFDRITRFLNTTPLSPVSIERTSQRKGTGATSYAVLGGIAVLVITAMVFLFNARSAGEGSASSSRNTPMHTSIQSTSSIAATMNTIIDTSTPVQPNLTATKPAPTRFSMVTSAPTQALVADQAVFIQAATSKAMGGDWTLLDNPLAFEPDVLVFAMPNYNSPASKVGIRNDHLIAVKKRVPDTKEQWAIINQDMGDMPQLAAFNVRILRPGTDAFTHTSTSANIKGNYTVIDNHNPQASNPKALVFAMPNWSPPDGSMNYNLHPIGVRFIENHWAIFNEDLIPMMEGAAFNVQILSPAMNAFVHTSTSSNILGKNYTIIDEAAIPADALVFVMPRISSEDNEVHINHPIGVWYTGEKWAIFYQDAKIPMPEGAEFNVLILQASQ